MAEYVVGGRFNNYVSAVIEADSPEEAIAIASQRGFDKWLDGDYELDRDSLEVWEDK